MRGKYNEENGQTSIEHEGKIEIFIHRDYKPANLAVGRPPDGLRSIFLLDWGLCRRYVNTKGQLLPARPVAPFRGTPRYASPNALALKEQGRLDDMWSWLYTLIDLTVGQLPWDEGLPDDSHADEQVDYLRVEKAKAAKDAKQLLRGCPLEYVRLLKYLNSLKFADPPNYARFRRVLHKVVSRKQLETLPLDWEPTSNLYPLMKQVPNASMVYTPPRKVEDLEEDDYERSSKSFL
uniref:Protein kinase domain-containing protein n=1 Tax=Romanomermis culicivorax TaxID=13658 RepID=A0A915I3G7_ROMCU